MAPPSHPICSPGSSIAYRSLVFSSRPLPAFPLSVTRPQAVPLSQVLSQMQLFSPAPYFRRTEALTCSIPLLDCLTEQWRNVGCTREYPLDPAVAGTPRLQPAVSPLQKEIVRECSLSVSGTMENYNTRLAPAFTLNKLALAPVNVAACRGLLGPGGFNSLYQMSLQQWNRFAVCGLRTSPTPLCSWGFAFPTRHCQVLSCGVGAFALPLFTVLMEFKPSPLSFLPF